MTGNSTPSPRCAALVASLLMILAACAHGTGRLRGATPPMTAAQATTTTTLPAATVTTPVATTVPSATTTIASTTTHAVATMTTAAPTRKCTTVGFTPNSEDAASSITATGLSCADAEAFVRMAGGRTSTGGPAQVDVAGYHCVRVRVVQEPLPQAFYECVNGPRTVTFVRS